MSAPGPARAAADTRSDWETPAALFDELNREFRFTLDAAATFETRKCRRYLTVEEDALTADVFDEVVWCNPPYGRGIADWCEAFARWSFNGCTVVALLPANTDTEWFHAVWAWAFELRLLRGRVSFVGTRSANTGGSMVAVYLPQPPYVPDEIRDEPRGRWNVTPVFHYPPRVILWDWKRMPGVRAALEGVS